jgi:glycosyltransferase involved in cell wall biosynthesis
MANTNRISVIIPVYNGERYLAEAIESVLAQTQPPHEIIVIDDGSTDGSAKIVERFLPAVQYHWQPNAGPGSARNCGVSLAHGAFLAFLDADDLWTEDKLDYQLAALSNDPTLDLVFGHVQQFYSPELDEQAKQRIRIPREIVPGIHCGAMLIRDSAFRRVGAFRTDLHLADFVDWHARAMEIGLKSLMLPDIVMKRRTHQTNLGIRRQESRGEYARVLKAALDRRRKPERG